MKKKRTLGILLCLALSFALMLAMSLTAYAEEGIKYLDNKGEEATYTGQYTAVTGSDSGANWSGGWYVVSGDVTISGRVDADGYVNLILCDGASLTINVGYNENAINFSNNGSLTVYAQSTGKGMGALTATAGNRGNGICADDCNVAINGGTVSVAGSNGGINAAGGTVAISGGKVTAGSNSFPAIQAVEINISGGEVTAEANSTQNVMKANNTVSISGGKVKVTGGNTGINTSNGSVTITGSEVTAEGKEFGIHADKGEISISDSTVTATGGTWRGISSEKISITSGKVTAAGGASALLGTVKNAIDGTGWTNAEGTGAGETIAVSTGGQDLSSFRKVQFPKKTDSGNTPSQTPTSKPASKSYSKPAAKAVTINVGTVSAKALDSAVAKARGTKGSVTTIVLGKKVKKISKGAFRNYRNAKTLVVKTKKLKKKSVKGSLKGSKVRTVKVQVGSKKANKKYVKKYKKIFTKKNAGKKVKVSR